MANRTMKDAASVHATNPQYLVEKIIRSRIYDSLYWKESCFALTAESLIDRATELKYVGGVSSGLIKPTPFMCLTLKLLQIQPEKEIILEYIANTDFKYLRCLGAFYLRLVGTAMDCYTYLEPILKDFRKIKRMKRDGGFELIHVDEFIDELLTEERVCDIILPRISVSPPYLPSPLEFTSSHTYPTKSPRAALLLKCTKIWIRTTQACSMSWGRTTTMTPRQWAPQQTRPPWPRRPRPRHLPIDVDPEAATDRRVRDAETTGDGGSAHRLPDEGPEVDRRPDVVGADRRGIDGAVPPQESGGVEDLDRPRGIGDGGEVAAPDRRHRRGVGSLGRTRHAHREVARRPPHVNAVAPEAPLQQGARPAAPKSPKSTG
eukprot:m.255217 g.255217  ORF g.255217 m.255217 type:complete len:375 (-) comp15944_c0_seq34:1393-2517(-)